ncbi:hypothetical protein BZA05DRAFT_443685 [Tricharina praecox]|uniref:uncharacterized protein n=1 Tax=Tricharina praecox TaxID=43433 RepID=UPI002220FC1A|nr:uncharacterized protein BZA05DRAFT_443685 [Tricharina praecox]KAI5854161.1 hypothetical protein BZA05DRAFT_443685 [Tricharina praecox]
MPAEPKTPHGGEPSRRGGKGKASIGGGLGGSLDGQSGAESGEDDEDDGEQDGETDKPAVMCPAGVSSQMPQARKLSFAAGPVKRTFDDADLGEFFPEGLDFDFPSIQDDDEPEFPRKKIPKLIAATTEGILTYTEPISKDDDDKTEGGYDIDDLEDDEITCEDDDGNITDEEEAAIVREFETDEDLLKEIGLLDANTLAPIDPELLGDPFDNALFDDLDGEIFDAMCNDPHRFDDLQGQVAFDWNSFTNPSDDLFSVHPTPVVTPNATPRASISEPRGGSFNSDDNESSEDEVQNLSPFFEMNNAAIKHLVSAGGKGGWSDGTDEDDADLLKYFFSSADEETDVDSDDSLTEDDDGDTTDEEEDLPMPTPCHASKLRRVSVSSNAARPQIIDTNKEGPELRAWVADPSRPICVIEGSKQIFLIPDSFRHFSVSGRTGSTTSDMWIPMEGESESEQSTIPTTFDPMLSELVGVDVGLLGAGEQLGPEGFFPFNEEDGGDIFSDLFNDEEYDVDEFEAGLEINDFLDLSSTEEGASETGKDLVEDMSDDCGGDGEEDEEDALPGHNADADMLSIWDKVSVTAFRKRQIQHSQKLSSALQFGGNGYHKGKEGRLAETITPTKKRRVRQKFLASNRGGMGNNPVVRKKPAR